MESGLNDYSEEHLGKLLSKSKLKELDSYLFKAIVAEPNQLSHYLWYGMSKLKQESFHESYQYTLIACQLSPLSADAFALKSLVLERLNLLSMARRALEKAIYLNPLNTGYSVRMKGLLEKLHQPESYNEKILYLPEISTAVGNKELMHRPVVCLAKEDRHVTNKIDVLLPVYSNFKATKDCLDSVLDSLDFNSPLDINVLVINDASVDPNINNFLLGLHRQDKIELIVNKHNLGFIKTVNKGFEQHLDRDVLLLNADTYVKGDWLKRLHRAVYSEERIASVTPLSNNAELVSFPVPMKNNKLANIDFDTVLFDTICKEVNSGEVVDIPTGVGFCMFIRRAALNEVGFLDAIELQRGYGEEVDLCFRFEAKGWKNKCATDVFVAHIGGCSFGQEKRIRVVQNLKILNLKYPHYELRYDQFLSKDPLYKFRKNIETALLERNAAKNKKYILILAPVKGWEHISMQDIRFSQAESLRNYIYLYFDNNKDNSGKSHIYLSEDKEMSYANLKYECPNGYDELNHHLQQLNIDKIEIHEISCFDKELLNIIVGLNIPYTLFVTDYSLMSERIISNSTQSLHKVSGEINELGDDKYANELCKFAETIYVDTEEVKERMSHHVGSSNILVSRLDSSYYISDLFQAGKRKNKHLIFLILTPEAPSDSAYTQLIALARFAITYSSGVFFLKIGHSAGDVGLKNTGKVKVISKKVLEIDSIDEFLVAAGVNAVIDMDEAPKVNYFLIKKLMRYKLPISISANNLPQAWSNNRCLFARQPSLNTASLLLHLISICQVESL